MDAPQKKMMIAYTIVERGQKRFWLRIGVAFENRDGSYNVKLDAVPVNGQLQLREWVADDEWRARREGRASDNGNGHGHDDVPAELLE